jgi:hypothetical protein
MDELQAEFEDFEAPGEELGDDVDSAVELELLLARVEASRLCGA